MFSTLYCTTLSPPSLYFSDADVKIALPSSDYVYDENAQTIKICANLTGDIERDLRIALLLEEETATCTYNHTTRSHTYYIICILSFSHTLQSMIHMEVV